MLIPGFSTGDWAVSTLNRWLARIGYRPYLSGIDLNVGCPNVKFERLEWRLEQISAECGAPVVLIGHSLGGVLARSLATALPGYVRHAITLGSPMRIEWNAIQSGARPAFRAIQALWSTVSDMPRDCGTGNCACRFTTVLANILDCEGRLSSIYTRADEVVDWQACVDGNAANYEVKGRHLSLVVNRDVYRLLASILAELMAAQLNGRSDNGQNDGVAPLKARA